MTITSNDRTTKPRRMPRRAALVVMLGGVALIAGAGAASAASAPTDVTVTGYATVTEETSAPGGPAAIGCPESADESSEPAAGESSVPAGESAEFAGSITVTGSASNGGLE